MDTKKIVAALVVSAGLSCTPATSGPTKTLKLGVVLDQTGSSAEPAWVDAVRLAAIQVNAALKKTSATKVNTLEFELVVADSANDPKVALPRAVEAVDAGVFGLLLDTTQAATEVNRRNYESDEALHLNVPAICGSCTAATINDPNFTTDAGVAVQNASRDPDKWLFRTQAPITPLMLVATRSVLEKGTMGDVNGDGKLKIAVYHSDDAFGNTGARDVKTHATRLHPSSAPIIEAIKHPATGIDFNTYNFAADLAKLTDNTNATEPTDTAYPDAIILPTFPAFHTYFVKAFKDGNYKANNPNLHVVHGQGFRFRFVQTALGSLAEGETGVSNIGWAPDESGTKFAADFQAKYNFAPPYQSVVYYDAAVVMMLSAIKSALSADDIASVTGAQVRDALQATSTPGGTIVRTGEAEMKKAIDLIGQGTAINYEGSSGPVDFNEVGDVRRNMVTFTIQNGLATDTGTFDCISDPAVCAKM